MKTFLSMVTAGDMRIWIPILMIWIPCIFLAFYKYVLHPRKKTEPLSFYPEISVVVDVHSYGEDLYTCLRSIANSVYPIGKLVVFLVDYRKENRDYKELMRCQKAFPYLRIQLVNACEDPEVALRSALHSSNGKYIFHISSDGELESKALKNMVARLESDSTLVGLTGAILTKPSVIVKAKGGKRLFYNLEFLEHARNFLTGRRRLREMDSVYRMTGSFSVVRKMSETDSLSYGQRHPDLDTESLRLYPKRDLKVETCEDALCFTVPTDPKSAGMHFRFDRQFSLLRLVWIIALVLTLVCNNPILVSLETSLVIYVCVIFLELFRAFAVLGRLRDYPSLRRYYRKHIGGIFLLPFFRLIKFFLRLGAGEN